MSAEDGGRREELDNLVSRFMAAEDSLRLFLDTATRLSKASEELAAARLEVTRSGEDACRRIDAEREHIRERLADADRMTVARLDEAVAAVQRVLGSAEAQMTSRMAAAERSVEVSQAALADTASGLYGLTSDLKASARDLKDCAIALRRLNPDSIERKLDGLQAQYQRSSVLAVGGAFLIAGAVAAVLLILR